MTVSADLGQAWQQLCARSRGVFSEAFGLVQAQQLKATGVALWHDHECFAALEHFEPLSLRRLQAALPNLAFDYHLECASTQDLARTKAAQRQPLVVLCERQTAGRGREGRAWHSPMGAHLYGSIRWLSARSLVESSALPLQFGLALCQWLRAHDIPASCKWPNDIWVFGRKLAGMLLEAERQGQELSYTLGLGLNLAMPLECAPDQPWLDLRSLGLRLDRNQLVISVLGILADTIARFEREGLRDFRAEFNRLHALHERLIRLEDGRQAEVEGIAIDGALLLDCEGERIALRSGSVHWDQRLHSPWRLLIDFGNTRLKWAVQWRTGADHECTWHGCLKGEPVAWRTSAWLQEFEDALAALKLEGSPSQVLLASTRADQEFETARAALETRWPGRLHQIFSPARHGMWRNSYAQPERLGVDRFLAMLALLSGSTVFKRALVVLAGTALTLDVLESDGHHLGGLIAPGAGFMQRQLAALSPRLQSVDAARFGLALSSPHAVAAGCWQMSAALIERVAEQQQVDCVVLAGGDAPALAVHLTRSVLLRDSLVLHGLASLDGAVWGSVSQAAF